MSSKVGTSNNYRESTSNTRLYSKWIRYLNIRDEIIQVFEENTGEFPGLISVTVVLPFPVCHINGIISMRPVDGLKFQLFLIVIL